VAQTTAEERQDEELFKEILRKGLKRFLRKKTGKRPLILPVMIEDYPHTADRRPHTVDQQI